MPILEPSPYSISGSAAFHEDGLDRLAAARTRRDELDRLWASAEAWCLVVRGGRALMDDAGLVMLATGQAPPGERILLGIRGDAAAFAVHADDDLTDPRAHGIRSAVARLPADQLGLLVHAIALTNWHESHPRCSRCGSATEVIHAGYARRCPTDGSEHHPRTDPAVIVLVIDGAPRGTDRCLLGRQATWPDGRFSTLAGFVEAGETVEDAVVREVGEEVGVPLTRVSYAGSQPWPFPASLMLAFYGVAAHGHDDDEAVVVDGTEIVEARWFDRSSLAEAMAAGEVLIPPHLSVARRLVEGWYGGPLVGSGTWR